MMSIKHFSIARPCDFHVHLRRGDMLKRVAKYTAGLFSSALVMPNTDPPILSAEDAFAYRNEIESVVSDFEPLMCIKLTPATTPDMIRAARRAGVVAAKFYPAGVTISSRDGFRYIMDAFLLFEVMDECGMTLCLHGERPDEEDAAAELLFLKDLSDVAHIFTGLRIVLEHISTQEAVCVIADLPDNVVATITAHHLLLTRDDVYPNGEMCADNFCKPVAKTREDREALVMAATSGNPKFFFGSDSAPHLREAKLRAGPAAGIFSAPVALLVLAQVFENRDRLSRLEDFTSRFGRRFYGIKSEDACTLRLVPHPWKIPADYDGIVPLCAGQIVNWNYETRPAF